MQVTVFGPNLPRRLADKGTIHVHKTGCRDIKTHRYPTGQDQGGWDLRDVDSIAEIVEDIYPSSDFDYDPDDPDQVAGYRQDIYVAPCVTLPERPALDHLSIVQAALAPEPPATVYVVSVEDENGAQYVLGPYTDRATAESRAAQHKHTLRLAAWKADGRLGHPDDPPVFAWVVELLPDGPPEHNPYEDAPLVVVGTEVQRDDAAGLPTPA